MKAERDILITGGFGFIGYVIAKRILEKYPSDRVTLLSRGEPDEYVRALQEKHGDRLKFDTRDIIDMDETWYPHADQIYHLAARKTTTDNIDDSGVLEMNLKTDDSVLWSMINRGESCKLLYVSTGEVFGPLWERMRADGFTWPVPERNGLVGINIYDPQWMYALSKIVGEAQIIHEGGDFRWSIARLQNPYGPRMGDKTLIPKLMQSAVTGEKASVFANDTRPFIYVDDVADAFIVIMNSSHTDGKIINVAGPEMEVGDLVPVVQRVAGAFVVDVKRREEHLPNHVRALDTTELQSLGWRPWVDIKEGIERTWEYYKDHIKP